MKKVGSLAGVTGLENVQTFSGPFALDLYDAVSIGFSHHYDPSHYGYFGVDCVRL